METGHILIVEDDAITASRIRNILFDNDHQQTLYARNHDDALYFIKNKKISFAFIDIHLSSERSGIDVAYKCLEVAQFPYVFLTGLADNETINMAKLTRPYGYLTKPVEEQNLISTLEVALYNFEHRRIDIDRYPSINANAQPKQLKDALDYVHKNAHKNIKTTDVAKHVNWSRSHLSKTFNEELNYSLKDYIIKTKVELVCHSLNRKKVKLKFVAEEFGFDSYVTFVNAFKKVKGLTPTQYIANKEKFTYEE